MATAITCRARLQSKKTKNIVPKIYVSFEGPGRFIKLPQNSGASCNPRIAGFLKKSGRFPLQCLLWFHHCTQLVKEMCLQILSTVQFFSCHFHVRFCMFQRRWTQNARLNSNWIKGNGAGGIASQVKNGCFRLFDYERPCLNFGFLDVSNCKAASVFGIDPENTANTALLENGHSLSCTMGTLAC